MLQTYPTISYTSLQKRRKEAMNQIYVYMNKKNISYDDMLNTNYYKKRFHKIKKVFYLLDNSYRFNERRSYIPKYLINHFFVEMDYDYWRNVFVFNTTDLDKVKDELIKLDIEVEGSSWTSSYDCTGRTFTDPCKFIKLSNRIVVIQHGALDV